MYILTKKYFLTAILFLLCLFIYSCGGDSGRQRKSVIYWSSNNTEEILFAKEMVQLWNKENPAKPVSFQPVPEGQSSEEIILAAVVGKTTPDLYSNMWQGDVESYAQAGVLVALDTLEGFNEFIYSRCDSSVVKEITSNDGHIYQVPWKINPIMMIYNKNIIRQIGLTAPPATYSDFFAACKRFMKDADNDGYIDHWFGYCEVIVTWWQRFFDFYPLYLAASNGAPLVKNNKAVFNNRYGLEVFKFLKTLYDRNYFSRERISQREDIFLSGVIATRFTGPWEIAHADKFKPEGFEYDYAPVPVPDGQTGPAYTYGDPKNIVIFKTSPDVNLTWRFVKFLCSNEGDLRLLNITNQVPRRKNISGDPYYSEYFRKHPRMQVFGKQAQYVRGTDASPVLKEVFDLISQQYEACVVYGKKTPEQALADAEKAVNLLFLK